MKQSDINKANADRMAFIKKTKTEFDTLIKSTVENSNEYIIKNVINNLETVGDYVINSAKNKDLLGDYFVEIIIPQINKNIIKKPIDFVAGSLYEQKDVIEVYFEKVMKASDFASASDAADKYLTSTFMFNGSKFLPDSQIKELQITKGDFDNLFFLFIPYLTVGNKTKNDLVAITTNYTRSVINERAETLTDNLWERNDRSLLIIYSNDLGINTYQYAGVIGEKSRQFCRERINKVFTYEEIMSWAELDWPQKQPYKYSPFLDCGGFGCKHVLVPVPDDIENDIQRQTEKRWTQLVPGLFRYV